MQTLRMQINYPRFTLEGNSFAVFVVHEIPLQSQASEMRFVRGFRDRCDRRCKTPLEPRVLQAVSPLKKGRTTARETDEVKPVPGPHIEKVLPLVSRQVREMIELQQLTGTRPGKLVIMRPVDIDRGKIVWLFRLVRWIRRTLRRRVPLDSGPRSTNAAS